MIRQPPPERGIFCNRTLNMRSIRAVGYDMDYTLVHYNTVELEKLSYQLTRDKLAAQGWPVRDLEFAPGRVIRGLTVDLELGNLLKATRFGYAIRAAHGNRHLEFNELRRAYAGTTVDLAEDRYDFMNTLYSLSEGQLYAHLVDIADAGRAPAFSGYADLYRTVVDAIDETHMEGALKDHILGDLERFIEPDPELVLTLQDQRRAGKRLMLITNSQWEYTQRVMEPAFDPFLENGETWRDLFDVVIVSANKPYFFAHRHPFYSVVDEGLALLRPHRGRLEAGHVYFGGNAVAVEESLGLTGDEILYVGDHLFGDVHVSKDALRWRTALVLRELESEVAANQEFSSDQDKLEAMMSAKQSLEDQLAAARLARQRMEEGYGPQPESVDLAAIIEDLKEQLRRLDEDISPLAQAAGELRNPTWGPLMRAGNDKSLFARQVERYADVYTSRVSNFLHATPFAFLRAPRMSLPHDPL